MKKSVILTLIILIYGHVFSFASDMAKYNELYKNDKYEEAYDGYASILKKDRNNPWAWYNAGNALFRLNRLGDAVYAYSKAFMLNPRNSDIRFNLEYSMRQAGQNFFPQGTPKSLYLMYYFLSDTELRALAILCFWIGMLGLAVFFSTENAVKKYSLRTAVITLTMCVCLGLWYFTRYNSQFGENTAVVTESGGMKLLSGPGENFKDYASAPEGMVLKVLNDSDTSYYEVGISAEGISGWVLKTGVKKLL